MKKATELYRKIKEYPQDTWADSPEFSELIKTLEENDIETLRENGYVVPSWKNQKSFNKPTKK